MDRIIRIRVEEIDKKTDAEKASERANGKTSGEAVTSDKNIKDLSTVSNTIATQIVWSGLKSAAINTASYMISNVGVYFNDQALQNEISNAVTVGSEALGFVASTAAGAKLGAAAGPIGAAIGAVAGAALSAINKAINYFENKNDYLMEQHFQSLDTSKRAERIGVLLNERNRK